MRMNGLQVVLAGVVVLAGWQAASAQSWGTAQLLNMPSETGLEVKTAKIAGARSGGFHAIYHVGKIRYRRYQNGSLLPAVDVFPGSNFFANGNIAEARNGDIHVIFENWINGPYVGWHRSTNGGASFSSVQNISPDGQCKHPQIAPFGLDNSGEIIMSYYHTGNKNLRVNRFNGTSWSGDAYLGSNGNSEYDVFGIGWSPRDGSVFRAFWASNALRMRQYTGSWGPDRVVSTGGWTVRQRIAVNDAGQVMLMWDENERVKTCLYTPGNGPGPIQDHGTPSYGNGGVCNIPGTNRFYLVGGNDHVQGRIYAGGTWFDWEHISNGLPNAFMVTPLVTADEAGALYAVWEYWGSGNPQQWYSVKPASSPQSMGTLAGTVTDHLGVPVPNARVDAQGIEGTITDANGNYSMPIRAGSCIVVVSKTYYNATTIGGININQGATTVRNFTISAQPPGLVSQFVVTPGNTVNQLSWANPSSAQFTGTMIRYALSGYPLSPQDGQLLLDQAAAPGTNGSFTHTGLTNGVAVHYAAFSYYQDASRHYAAGVVTRNTPFGPADFDHDGDVDQVDYGFFQACYSGSAMPQNNPACAQARLDGDEDVDMNDFGIFQACISGPGIPANPACAN